MVWQAWKVSRLAFFVPFVVIGLLINLLQTLAYLLLVIVMDTRSSYERVNRWLMWLLGSLVVFLCQWWSGSSLQVFADDKIWQLGGREKALVLGNHHYEADWMMTWMLCDYFNLSGSSKGFGKRSLRFSPLLGWAWRMSDFIFLARRWTQDKEVIRKGVDILQNYSHPIWLFLFSEGTRWTPAKYEASLKYAEERQLPSMKHHLVPRTKGFVATVTALDPNKIEAIYDVTLATNEDERFDASFVNVLKGKGFKASCYVRRFDMKQVPREESKLAEFLMQVYREKDELKENFITTGSFTRHGQDDRFKEYKSLLLPASKVILGVVTSLMLLTNVGLIYTIIYLCSSGSPKMIALAVGLAVVPAMIMKVMTTMSKADAAGRSKYQKSQLQEKKSM